MKSKIHIQSYFDIYKQPWSVVIFINSEKNDGFNFSSNLCPILGIHSKMWKSNVMVGQQLAAIWQTNFAKEEAAKAKIFNIFHRIRSYLFFSTFVGLHLKNQSYQEGKWEFQHVSQNRFMSRKDPRYKWNCLCISGLTKRWMWEVRARFVKIFQHFWWFCFYSNLLCIEKLFFIC